MQHPLSSDRPVLTDFSASKPEQAASAYVTTSIRMARPSVRGYAEQPPDWWLGASRGRAAASSHSVIAVREYYWRRINYLGKRQVV